MAKKKIPSEKSNPDFSTNTKSGSTQKALLNSMDIAIGHSAASLAPSGAGTQENTLQMLGFLDALSDELDDVFDLCQPNAHLRMALHLLRGHFEGKIITPTALIGASHVPYATANRRLKDMVDAGLIDQRPRTKTGKTFSMHPSDMLLSQWTQLGGRLRRVVEQRFVTGKEAPETQDYYFGGSYARAQSIPPLRVRTEPLRLAGGVRVLVHGDPTFMVMDQLKRQFEQSVGTTIHQRAFSIDRLREEAIRNAARPTSRYDIIAVDLPWIGEFAEAGILTSLEDVMDIERLDPADFHTAGWQGAHWGGKPYGVPAQTTPELLFYRRDLFASAGLEPPTTTDALLHAARTFHEPRRGQYGIAWNAARGTALGHTVMMVMADHGQPILDLNDIAGGYDTACLAEGNYRVTLNTEAAREAAEFLLKLLKYSPPDILSMSWYERVRPYAAGTVAMAYGYTLLAPYFELDESSPAAGQTGYLPHPAASGIQQVAPVGGYVLGIPSNLAPERVSDAVEALTLFTSREAQKLYVQNGSRTNARYSVAADPDVRRTSHIFDAVDGMSWRDELQFWPRPPVPEIAQIAQVFGEEFHDMLRGIIPAQVALTQAEARAQALIDNRAKGP
ncbi:MAG: extracellular solute-binding protein [Pseudomonadota bacterium]